MRITELFDLSEKHALVGGSTSGIGLAIAQRFAEAGAKVTLMARNEEKLKNSLQTLTNTNHDYIVADFTNPNQVKQQIDNYLKSNNPIDILVNNTGGPPPGAIIDADIDEFLNAFQMHLVCNQILTQAVIDNMKEQNWGRIINIISTSVRQPIPNLGVSNTIRGAVGNWAKTLANEVGRFNITVNNILPGPIRTPRMTQIIENRANSSGQSKDDVESDFTASVPLGRIGKPDEIGTSALFLASYASSYISGTNLIVDGGRTKTY